MRSIGGLASIARTRSATTPGLCVSQRSPLPRMRPVTVPGRARGSSPLSARSRCGRRAPGCRWRPRTSGRSCRRSSHLGQQENGASGSTGEGLIRHASGTPGFPRPGDASRWSRLGTIGKPDRPSASPQPESARRAPRPPVYPNGSGPPAGRSSLQSSVTASSAVRMTPSATVRSAVSTSSCIQSFSFAPSVTDPPFLTVIVFGPFLGALPRRVCRAPTRGRRDAEPPASARVNGLSVSAVFQTTHLGGSYPVPGARPSSDRVPIHCRAVSRGRRAMAVTGPGMRGLPRGRGKALVGPLRGSNLHREPGRAHGPALAGWSWSAAGRRDRHGRRSAETRS